MSDVFPKGGVKICYVTGEFIEIFGGIDSIRGLSTEQVCRQLIMPSTLDAKSSYCDLLKQQGHPAFVEKADAFVSHAHSYSFEGFLSALRWRFRNEPDASVWIDLFSINQHQPMEWSFDWLSTVFKANVAEIGRTVMVMSPWNNPLPYTRSWCVFEAYCTVISGGNFEIALSKNDEKTFLQDIVKSGQRSVDDMLGTIRAENSECSVVGDQESIFAVIRSTIGFLRLDSVLFESYREWAIQVSLQALDACTSNNDRCDLLFAVGDLYLGQGRYEEAEKYNKQCVESLKKTLGADDPKTLVAMQHLAWTHANQGKYSTAKLEYRLCLGQQLLILGEDHKDTLDTMHNAATTLDHEGEYAEAEGLYRRCLKRRISLFGDKNRDTLRTMNALVATLENRAKYEEAADLCLSCWARTRETLGALHPDTLIAKNNLATCLNNVGKHALAEEFARACLEQQQSMLGTNNPDTLITMNNLASTLDRQQKYAEAEEVYRSCLQGRKSTLGEDHPHSEASSNSLSTVLMIQGKYAEAAELLEQSLNRQTSILGDEDKRTLRAMYNLAIIFHYQVRHTEAESLLRSCLPKQQRVLGTRHPETLRTMDTLASSLHQQAKFSEAEDLYRACLEGQKGVPGGEDSMDTLNAMNNLAVVLVSQEKYAEAQEVLELCLQRHLALYGADHPQTMAPRSFLAMVKEKQGNHTEAEELRRQRTTRGEEASLGKDRGAPPTIEARQKTM